MENTNSIELYNKAVKEYKELKRLNLERIKRIYPDVEIITEEDAFLHFMHNSESLEGAFERITANYPKDQTSINASIAWNRFNHNNRNTDFLERETFELFFHNEYNFLLQSGKTNGLKSIEAVHKVFLRLHEIYNKRFIDSEPHETEKLTNFERLYWFQKIGGFDLPLFKKHEFTNSNRDKILAKVLGINTRDVKSFINNDTKNPLTDADKSKMDKDFANLLKAKSKK